MEAACGIRLEEVGSADADTIVALSVCHAGKIAGISIEGISIALRSVGVMGKSIPVVIAERPAGAERKTEVQLRLEKSPCPVNMDKRLMGVALTHLYMNASEAAQDNGVIHISTHSMDEKTVIRVKDNGDGIRPEFMDRIFDPFFSTKSGGTGLGLTYVQQIIHDHGGKIHVESHPRDGATFVITFPRDEGTL